MASFDILTNNWQLLGSAITLDQDYIHDYGDASTSGRGFSAGFHLNLSEGIITAIERQNWFPTLTSSKRTNSYNSSKPSNFFDPHPSGINDLNRFAVLVEVFSVANNTSEFIAAYGVGPGATLLPEPGNRLSKANPYLFSRLNWFSGLNAGADLSGPYSGSYDNPGAYIVKLWPYINVFNWYGNRIAGAFDTINSGGHALPFIVSDPLYRYNVAMPPKVFNVNVFQRAVAITQVDNSTGAILPNGSTISNMDNSTNNKITLTKINNRGDNTSSLWSIEKQVAGVFVPAILNTDYSFNLGQNLASDLINITWVLGGIYRVKNNVVGLNSVKTGPNTNTHLLTFQVGADIIDVVTLPVVNFTISATDPNFDTIISTNPVVTAVGHLAISVTVNVDITSASWSQTVGANPTAALTLTQTDWENELLSRCTISCTTTNLDSGVETLIGRGLGPHKTNLTVAGEYEIKIKVEVKPDTNGDIDFGTILQAPSGPPASN